MSTEILINYIEHEIENLLKINNVELMKKILIDILKNLKKWYRGDLG
jgi:hypothetical protein